MAKNTDLIPIVTNDYNTDNSKNIFPTHKRMVGKVSEVQIGTLQANIAEVIDKTLTVFDNVCVDKHKYNIDSITISLNVSNGGKVSLVGEVSANVDSGLTVVLKKRS